MSESWVGAVCLSVVVTSEAVPWVMAWFSASGATRPELKGGEVAAGPGESWLLVEVGGISLSQVKMGWVRAGVESEGVNVIRCSSHIVQRWNYYTTNISLNSSKFNVQIWRFKTQIQTQHMLKCCRWSIIWYCALDVSKWKYISTGRPMDVGE
jgi:hypothetical protein